MDGKIIKDFFKPNKTQIKYFLVLAIIFCVAVTLGDYSLYSKEIHKQAILPTIFGILNFIKNRLVYFFCSYLILLLSAYLISCGIYSYKKKFERGELSVEELTIPILFSFIYWIPFILFLYFYYGNLFSEIVILFIGTITYLVLIRFLRKFRSARIGGGLQ